jgi:hypothetical protein
MHRSEFNQFKWLFYECPTLSCTNIGEPVSNNPIIYKITRIGQRNKSPKNENKKSNMRIIIFKLVFIMYFKVYFFFLKLLMVLIRPSSADKGSFSIPIADFIF